MFYIMDLEEYIRVEPELFGLETKDAIMKQLDKTYTNFFDKEIGAVLFVLEIESIGEGIIIPGDGAVYYNTSFQVLTFKPELQELVYGVVDEITNFGALVDLGIIKGMLHISQAMDDYVNFSKSNVLTGKNSKRALKKGDLVLARIVALSFKGDEPKIGLTMRQPGLGKLEWMQEDKRRASQAKAKVEKGEETERKGKKK